MSDPISGQMASQAAASMLEQTQGGQEASGAGNFREVFDGIGPGEVETGNIGAVEEAAAAEAPDAVEEVKELPTDDFIQGLLREESEIQAMMERCLSGAAMGPDEMLQMQALIYSYSQRVDLTTKVVEKATSGVQQVMNTQV